MRNKIKKKKNKLLEKIKCIFQINSDVDENIIF